MFDFEAMRTQMRKVVRARYNLDKARAQAARNASISGFSTMGDENIRETAETAYEAAKAELGAMRKELTPLLQKVADETKRMALYQRYIEGRSVRAIAYNMVYSESYMFKLIERAENEVNAA